MNRDCIGKTGRVMAMAALAAAIICGGLGAFCAFDTGMFYAGAQQIEGTIVSVNSLPGGNAPMVEFVDDTGLIHLEQFGPFYETATDAVGQRRTVLYNPGHELRHAIASPRNWIGSIVYGTATMGSLAIAGVFFVAAKALPKPLAKPNGA